MKKICILCCLGCSLLILSAQPAWTNDFLKGLALEFKGQGEPDLNGAVALYEKAESAGSTEALRRLFYLKGPLGPLWAGPEQWQPWLYKAAQKDWPEAHYQMGAALEKKLYPAGKSSPYDWYYKAALNGHGPAALRLGEYYLQNKDRQGLMWLALAAQMGQDKAALSLGKYYLETDILAAENWLKKSQALKPEPETLSTLATLLFKQGRNVEAETALKQAAQMGYPPANLELGFLALQNKLGQKANPREALRHFKIAAAAALPEGAYQLAQMYLAGQATPKDAITAAYWFDEAKRLGHPKAADRFNDLFQNFSQGQKSRLKRMIDDKAPPLSSGSTL